MSVINFHDCFSPSFFVPIDFQRSSLHLKGKVNFNYDSWVGGGGVGGEGECCKKVINYVHEEVITSVYSINGISSKFSVTLGLPKGRP